MKSLGCGFEDLLSVKNAEYEGLRSCCSRWKNERFYIYLVRSRGVNTRVIAAYKKCMGGRMNEINARWNKGRRYANDTCRVYINVFLRESRRKSRVQSRNSWNALGTAINISEVIPAIHAAAWCVCVSRCGGSTRSTRLPWQF